MRIVILHPQRLIGIGLKQAWQNHRLAQAVEIHWYESLKRMNVRVDTALFVVDHSICVQTRYRIIEDIRELPDQETSQVVILGGQEAGHAIKLKNYSGQILYDNSPEEAFHTLISVQSSEYAWHITHPKSHVDITGEDHQERLKELSPREREVVSGVVRGWTYKEISKQLNVGESTVKKYAARAYEKLEVPGGRLQLRCLLALDLGS